MKKIIYILSLFISMTFLLITILGDIKYSKGVDFDNWLVNLPFILLMTTLSILLLCKKNNGTIFHDTIKYSFFFGFIVSVLILGLVTFHINEFGNGIVYWAFVILPIFWFGYPSLILGAIIGLTVGLIKRRKSLNQSQ